MPQSSFPIAGIGASAGGLEAFERFFDAMPPDSGAAFVLVQHLAPHHESLLSELLSKHTVMVLGQVEDDVRVEPNHVYIIPPNTALTLTDCRLRLSAASETLRVPIDGFFASLAEAQRHCAVGIVFSGTGSDGSLGIRAIRENGGMTMAQTPESARFDGMPRSAIATGCVDSVLTVEEMPARLSAHLRRLAASPPAPELATSDLVPAACRILTEKTGHDFSRYKESTLGRRISRRMQLMLPPSVDGYLARLRTDPHEVDSLLKDVLINVTQFFRDPEVFEVLARDVVPKLFAGKGTQDVVRVWVPGCASGEEAYSIGMLLSEHAATLDAAPEVKIFASDIDDDALAEARRGRYSAAAIAPISPDRLERFFNHVDDAYEVKKPLRDMCVFAKHNLINNPPFSRLDLVSCRNTRIYLRSDLQDELLALLHYALRPGGYLLLGPTESVAARAELFRAVSEKHRLFVRREPVVLPALNFPLGESIVSSAGRLPPEKGRRAAKAVERLLLQKYVPASVVVGEHGEILYLAGPTQRYIEQPIGAPSLTLLDLVRPELRLELRTALQSARATNVEVVHRSIPVKLVGELRQVDLTVRPVPELGADFNALLVVFSESDSPALTSQEPVVRDEPATAQLEREMERTRESLMATIDDRQASNEQLQTANEELLSMNEEMASTNEELQTSREEMQSINEELQTLTAELRQRIVQLDAANGDLRNIFESSHVATLFLDGALRIKRFTPAAKELFRLVETDLDRPLADIMPRFSEGDLMTAVAEVMRTQEPREREVHRDEGDRWYVQRVQPYRTVNDAVDGVVVTFIDVTERKQAADALAVVDRRKNEFLAMLAHELRNPLVPIRTAAFLLRQLPQGDPGAEEARNTIDRQVTHMVRMIDDLLDISRVEQGKIRLQKARIDLVELVRNTVEDSRSVLVGHGLTIEVELPDEPLYMMGDSTRLSQIVGNLLDNAGKFTDAGGRVRISLRAPSDRKQATLVVEDTGIGMDAALLPRVFDVFSQVDGSLDRSRGGMGLGLSLVKGLVTQHGGSVRAESEGPGQGSRFVIELPLSAVDQAPIVQTVPALAPVATAPRQRILVVEDNEDAAATMKMVLELWGHRVEVAHDGKTALELAKPLRPDVVLCDIGLPGGMDGYAVARALRADPAFGSAHLVALTGYGRAEDKAQTEAAGFDEHLTKPPSIEDLKRAIGTRDAPAMAAQTAQTAATTGDSQ